MSTKEISHKKLTPKELFYASIRKKTYVEIGISLIIFIALLVFALLPTIDSLDNVNEKLSEFRDLNTKVSKNIQVVRALKKQIFVDLKEEYKFIDNFVLDEKDLHLVYYNIFKRAEKANVRLESLRVDTMSNDKVIIDDFYKKPFYVIGLNLSSQNITNIVEFIKSLEGHQNMPIVSRVNTVNINKKYKDESPVQSVDTNISNNQQTENNVQTTRDTTNITNNNDSRNNNTNANTNSNELQGQAQEYFVYVEIRIIKIQH